MGKDARKSIETNCNEYLAKKSDPIEMLSRLVKQVLKACGVNVSIEIQQDTLAERTVDSTKISFAAKIQAERNAQANLHASPSR